MAGGETVIRVCGWRKESVLNKMGGGEKRCQLLLFTIINKKTRLIEMNMEVSPYQRHQSPTSPETEDSEKATSENWSSHTHFVRV